MVVAMVTCFGAGAQAGRSLLQTATCPTPALPDVNLTAYQGVWFQIGSTALLKSITETNLVCTTGRYSIITSGPDTNAIRLHIDSYNTSSGQYIATVGLASVVGRQLSLQFPGAPSPSDYRIIYLGGDAEEKYKTAVTYSCSPGAIQSINILSRKPTLSDGESVAKLMAFASSVGITLEANNQFVETVQDPIICGRNID
jgi:apolipoprotein D and lipocalin family protein